MPTAHHPASERRHDVARHGLRVPEVGPLKRSLLESGSWSPAPDRGDPSEGLAAGSLHVDLDGVRLAGRFAFARTGPGGGKEQWLLIHKHDDKARSGWDAEDHPTSVRSGRTNDEVVEDHELRRQGVRLTKADLLVRARRQNLRGRSTLGRNELAAALDLP